ncbi:MAG TPA: hypothetical protein VH370_26035 [Humisphaera sp.]|nr:hypothetical protein [Humisphaera sp.]
MADRPRNSDNWTRPVFCVHNQKAPSVAVTTQAAAAPANAPSTGGGTRSGPAPVLAPLITTLETATATTAASVNLSWSGGTNATSFEIDQLNSDGRSWFVLATVPGTATTFTATVAGGQGTIASFRVVSINSLGAVFGKPFRVMTTYAAGNSNLSLKNVVYKTLVSAEASHKPATYYTAAGVDWLFNQEFAIMNDCSYVISKLPAGVLAQFSPNLLPGNVGTVKLAAALPPPAGDTVIHELAHALDSKHRYNLLAASKECFAYGVERTLAGANSPSGLVSLAKMDTYSFVNLSISSFWTNAWLVINANVVGTLAPFNQGPLISGSATISSNDIATMQKILGLRFSESGLSRAYQQVLFLRGFSAAQAATLMPPSSLAPCYR